MLFFVGGIRDYLIDLLFYLRKLEFSNKLNIPFFDWFHVYTVKKNINYPFQIELVGNRNFQANVITVWHLQDDEMVQSEFPPSISFKLRSKDKDNPPMASPFKTKTDKEPITSEDIKNLMEQSNYTNKYLQAIGEKLGKKPVEPHKDLGKKTIDFPSQEDLASSSYPPPKIVEKPIFKPFKVSKGLRNKLRYLQIANSEAQIKEKFSDELFEKVRDYMNPSRTII